MCYLRAALDLGQYQCGDFRPAATGGGRRDVTRPDSVVCISKPPHNTTFVTPRCLGDSQSHIILTIQLLSYSPYPHSTSNSSPVLIMHSHQQLNELARHDVKGMKLLTLIEGIMADINLLRIMKDISTDVEELRKDKLLNTIEGQSLEACRTLNRHLPTSTRGEPRMHPMRHTYLG